MSSDCSVFSAGMLDALSYEPVTVFTKDVASILAGNTTVDADLAFSQVRLQLRQAIDRVADANHPSPSLGMVAETIMCLHERFGPHRLWDIAEAHEAVWWTYSLLHFYEFPRWMLLSVAEQLQVWAVEPASPGFPFRCAALKLHDLDVKLNGTPVQGLSLWDAFYKLPDPYADALEGAHTAAYQVFATKFVATIDRVRPVQPLSGLNRLEDLSVPQLLSRICASNLSFNDVQHLLSFEDCSLMVVTGLAVSRMEDLSFCFNLFREMESVAVSNAHPSASHVLTVRADKFRTTAAFPVEYQLQLVSGCDMSPSSPTVQAAWGVLAENAKPEIVSGLFAKGLTFPQVAAMLDVSHPMFQTPVG